MSCQYKLLIDTHVLQPLVRHSEEFLSAALQALLPLQVKDWLPCPHNPGCIVVNVGDALQAWSDGILKSNYHRVRMPEPGEPTVQPSRLSLMCCIACCASLALCCPKALLAMSLSVSAQVLQAANFMPLTLSPV